MMINVQCYEWLEKVSRTPSFVETIAEITERASRERYDMEFALRFLILSHAVEKDLEGIKDVDAYITKAMRSIAVDPA